MNKTVYDMPDLRKIMKRTQSYRYEDGIGEMVYGFALLLIGLLNFLEAIFRQSQIPSFGGTAFMILVAGCFLLGSWVVPTLKRRLVFPRTGFVEYIKPSARSRGRAIAIAVIVAAIIGAVTAVLAHKGLATARNPAVYGDWSLFVMAFIVGAYLALLGFGVGQHRYWLLAGFSMLLGGGVLLAHLGVQLGTASYFSAMGLALMLSGALALRAYLRKAPQPEGQ